MVQKISFLNIAEAAILIAELIDIGFNFEFGGRQFFFAIGLVHFGDNFALLLDGPDGPVAAAAPGLGANILHKGVLTGFAFLYIIGSNVDRVHFLHFKLLYLYVHDYNFSQLYSQKVFCFSLCYFLFTHFFPISYLTSPHPQYLSLKRLNLPFFTHFD